MICIQRAPVIFRECHDAKRGTLHRKFYVYDAQNVCIGDIRLRQGRYLFRAIPCPHGPSFDARKLSIIADKLRTLAEAKS